MCPLFENKFIHNFLDTNYPMCYSDDGIKNAIYYMLLCQECTVHRNELLGKVSTICKSYGVYFHTLSNDELLLLLLYGNDAFNESSNEDILSATIFYINSTKTDGLVIFSCSEFFCYSNFLLFSYKFCLFFYP